MSTTKTRSRIGFTSLRGPGGGTWRLAASERGLLALSLPGSTRRAFERDVDRLLTLAPGRPSHDEGAVAGVEEYAELVRGWCLETAWHCFWFPPRLDLRGSAFHRRCWERLRKFEPSQTATYGELASLAGSPRAARAVGSAMRANPTPLFVPCHRVLATTGLGGFGNAGLGLKRHLLEIEDAVVEAVPRRG